MADAPNHEVILSLIERADLFSKLRAGFDAEGDLVISGQDIGDIVEEHFGRDEYEYWITVPQDAMLRLATALSEVIGEVSPVGDSLPPFATATLKRLFSGVGGFSIWATYLK